MPTNPGDPFAVDPDDREVVLYQRTPAGRTYRTEPMLSTVLAELPRLLAAGRLVTIVLGTPTTDDDRGLVWLADLAASDTQDERVARAIHAELEARAS